MPLQATSGAASYDAFGGGAAVAPKYIEDFFQTWLRTGTGSSATVTTGLNASINKSLVWTKSRSAATNHKLTDTVRGATKALSSNTTSAEATDSQGLTAFSSTGYTIGTNTDYNNSGATYVDWQWLATPKFFDVVTYTGNGTAGRTVAHNLGSEPGCIIIKKTTDTENWGVYHRSLGNTASLALNLTNASGSGFWNSTTPTSTEFTLGNQGQVNDSGQTYVAYLFAHNAGGFGLSGTDNVISCGSYTGNGSATGPVVTLGYEPQWVMVKRTDSTSNWTMFDTMRGMSQTSANLLYANLSDDEGIGTQGWVVPNATGFQLAITQSSVNASGSNYIYIAIRRGPMAVPTTGTSVFAPVVYAGNGTTQNITSGFANDMQIIRRRASAENNVIEDKLRGSRVMFTNTTDSELTSTGDVTGYLNTGFTLGASNQGSTNDGGSPSYISWNFRRAPGFFDEVCYTGTGANLSVNHNLGVAPEMMIVKRRNTSQNWYVSHSGRGSPWATFNGFLNDTGAFDQYYVWYQNPTSTQFFVEATGGASASGGTYVSYLFASCPGVSKVGSYTGNGSSQTINCGFTGGARFVMIKRTNSTGDWYVWDTARGIVSGNDPHLSLNTTAAEVTSNDTIDTDSTGFVVNQVSATNVNVSSATYIFMAVA